MIWRIFACSVAIVFVGACSGDAATVGEDGGPGDGSSSGGDPDATVHDATPGGGEAAASDGQVGVSDAGADAASDAGGDVTSCDECKPDFCGCGACTPDQVVCTKDPIPCPLSCASSCDLSQYKCACEADRCVRVAPPPDKTIPCYSTFDCPPGNCCKKRSGPFQGACIPGDVCL
jgi:hypothetical protein